MHLASTCLKVQIGHPLLCLLHKPDLVEWEVYAAEVNVYFDLVIGKGP